MTEESLVGIPGLWGACTSGQAVAAATALARSHERGAVAWAVGTDDGCDGEGRSVRWEVHFDLATRHELLVSVGFTRDEETGTHGAAVAAVRLLPFPSEGSELARMALAGQITGRRLRAVWRQQARERQPLPQDFPDSAMLARAVAPDLIRTAHARITRARGACWVVRTKAQVRHIRAVDLA